MSDEIKKICNNCDNLQYGFGESSINYGPRCFEKDCGVDENDTCDMFEIASYLKVKKLQEQNKNLEYESKKKDLIIENLTVFLKIYQNSEDECTYREIQKEIYLAVHDYLNFINRKQTREALAKVNNENN